MYPGSLPYALSLFIVAVLTGGISLYAFHRTKKASAKSFGWLMIAITEWVMAYAIETLAPTLNSKILAEQFTYLGISAAPIFWFVFAMEYTGTAKWLTFRIRILLDAWPLVALAITLTNNLHHLMWKSARLDPNGLPGLIFESYGPAFWAIVAIAYALVLAGITLYIIAYLKSTRLFKRQIGIMVIGSLIPLVSNAVFLTDQFQQHGLDRTPFTFALSGILLAFGFFQYDLLNLIPLAAPLIIENLRDAVIVMDNLERIVNLNPAAYKWLNIGEDAIGQDAHQVLKGMDVIWEHWDAPEVQFQLELGKSGQQHWYHLMISSLRDQRGKVQGRVIVARDRTREQEGLLAERRHTRQIELLNSITRAALESTNFQEILQTLADQLGRVLEADGAYITLWDKSNRRAIPTAAYGKLQDIYPSTQIDANEQTLTESVLIAGHPLALEDVFNSQYVSRSIATRFPARSILALPLIASQEKLGAALIAFDHPHQFTPDEISVGEQVGSQIALAIYKAQLLETGYRRVAQLGLLGEVSKHVSKSLNEKEILKRTVTALVNHFGYAAAVISLLTKDNQLEITVITGTEEIVFKPGYRQKIGEGIIGHVAETRQPYFTGDVTHDPYFFTIGKRSGSALGVPMLEEGRLLGVLYVESFAMNAFVQDDVQILQTLTSHVTTAIEKARLYAQSRGHLRAMTTLQSISQAITSSLDLDRIFQMVVQLLKDTFDYTYISIYLLDNKVLRLGAQVGYPADTIFQEIPMTVGVVGRTISTKQTQFVTDVSKDEAFLRASHEVESEICVPLFKGGDVIGVINVEAAPGHLLTENDVELLTALAGPVAIAVDNARLHAEVKSLALTDGMTQLLNRRAFDQTLTTEIDRADRYGYPLALIIMDLDSFKEYNDRWGHPAGDERIIAIAKLLQSNVRSPDAAARYGGEEFALILPYTSQKGALALAERIRKTAEAQAIDKIKSNSFAPGYTLSLGVATFPENSRNANDLLVAADNASLAAKRMGKNRVCLADDLKQIQSTQIAKSKESDE